MENIERAFYHELGHYVAHSLNKKLYGRFGITELEIYPCKEDQTIWCGHVSFKKPEDFDDADSNKPPPIERLHFVLASIMYGCLFQAYYCETDLKSCFDKFGCKDSQKWIGFLTAHKISCINKVVATMEQDYLQELIEGKQLDDFMHIKWEDYLIQKNDERYICDLEKLENNLGYLIDGHAKWYEKVVCQYEQIIKKSIVRQQRS